MRQGAVVAYRGRLGVVWRVLSDGLAIVPVCAGDPAVRSDVAVTALADRIAARATGACYVRAGVVLSVPAAAQERVGEISVALLAAIDAAVARAARDRADAAKWESDRAHRRVAYAEVAAV